METKYDCEKCQYKCSYLSEWNDHLICKKHTTKEERKKNLNFTVKNVILDVLYKFCLIDI